MYDRQLLLGGAKRNSVLELWEVQRYGLDSYGDADYVSIYGMPPTDWYAKGIRLLGRTTVECTRDRLADAIGRDVALTLATVSPAARAFVIDPFVGSGNTLYWLLRHLSAARGVGFELDATVFQLTKRNLAIIESPIDILNADYAPALADASVATDQMVIVLSLPRGGTHSVRRPVSTSVAPRRRSPGSSTSCSAGSRRTNSSARSRSTKLSTQCP